MANIVRHKIIDKKEILNCPVCNSKIKSSSFVDWNGLNYDFCGQCGSTYQNPKVEIEYEENYWGEIIDPDGNKRVLKDEKELKIKNWYGKTVNYVNSLDPGKILDIGAGLGFFLSGVDGKWEKYAQDYSSYSLEFIKEEDSKVNICNDDLCNFSFEDNKFDVIMFYHVIEHLENPGSSLNEINRILKEDGILLVGTPNIKSIASRLFKGNFRHYGPPHTVLFTPSSLKDLLYNNGFGIFKKEYPFWGTDYANFKNISRMFYPKGLSPAFYGSVMTYYCKKLESK